MHPLLRTGRETDRSIRPGKGDEPGDTENRNRVPGSKSPLCTPYRQSNTGQNTAADPATRQSKSAGYTRFRSHCFYTGKPGQEIHCHRQQGFSAGNEVNLRGRREHEKNTERRLRCTGEQLYRYDDSPAGRHHDLPLLNTNNPTS